MHGNELTGSRGEIASPLFPSPYIQRGDFTWRVTVDEGRRVRIYFNQFSLEKDSDSNICITALFIHDGYDQDAPLLGQLCGDRRPDRLFATSNVVFIRFSSRYVNEGSFFRLTWEAVTWAPPVNPPANRTACGGDVYVSESNATAVIRSPGFPDGYAENLQCTWTLTADAHYRVSARFDTLDMEAGSCQFDQVEVRDPLTSRSLGRYCRRDQQGQTVTATGNQLQIVFRTDSSVNATGFQLSASTGNAALR